MQHVEPSALAALPDRLSYTHSFLEFAAEDGATIEASAPLVSPLIPTILDAVYTKLLSFDITAKSFVPKTPADPEGNEAPARLQDLHLEHAHIKRQMSFLKGYIVRIAGNRDWTPSSSLWAYMDKVAVMHTGSPGFIHRIKRPALRVECMHLALLLGMPISFPSRTLNRTSANWLV